MKKLSIIAAIAALAFLGTACTKNDPNGGNNSNFPEINTFVETYFSRTSIQKIETDNDEIEVKLADKTEIDFYLNYDWKMIDCEDSRIYVSVPTELVPTQITDYVTANYPNNHIDKIEKHHYGWEIELDNDFEIEFDSEFNVMNGGGNGGGNGSGTTPDYPEINTFIATYFPQTSILKVETDDHEIEVELTDRTEIDFYLNYDWKMIDCEHSQIYGIVPAELVPTQITDYMSINYPNNHIDKIEKTHHGGWEIELDNGVEIEFDQDFNVIEVGHK
jgi:preprotein translocase subunit YajC